MSPSGARRGKPRGIFEPKPNPWLARSLERVWYLLLPLLGVWFAEANFIQPNVSEIRNEGIISRLKNESAGRKLLNEMNAAESAIRAAMFERDSVLAPAIARRVFMVDSLRTIARGETTKVDQIIALIDSLDGLTARYQEETAALGDSLVALKQQKADVEASVLATADSLGRVRARVNETWTKVNALNASRNARSGQIKKPTG
ncbi:MAG: hypothetical protein ACKVU1_18595 [bacterium]